MAHFDERLSDSNESRQDLTYSEHIARYMLATQFARGKTVLDAASGTGYGSKLLADAGADKVIGIDIDKQSVEAARHIYRADNLEYMVDSAESLMKIEDKSIDLAVSFETIEHIKDYQGFLRNIVRVLKDDGLAVISTPNRTVFQEQNPYHLKEFSKREFRALLGDYFRQVELLEQVNGLASVIKGGDSGKAIADWQMTADEPLYFIALAAKESLKERPSYDTIGFNAPAWHRREQNKAWQAVNKVYKIYSKFKKD